MEGKYRDQMVLLESNIDDMSGEFFADLLSRLFDAGALDAWFTPVYGKKNRPLYQLSALVPPENEDACVYAIFKHSTTAGLRRQLIDRIVADRGFVNVTVRGEKIAVKRLQYKDIVKYTPEWGDCAAAAEKLGLAVREIYAEAQVSAEKSGE